MVMRREVFEKIGMFDEIYFMYSEEVDLCYRVQQTGLRVIYFPAASAIHLGGASSERNSRRINELLYLSRLKFRRKHFGLWATFIQIFGVGSIALLKLIPIGLRILIIPRNRAERQNRFVRNINIFFLMVHLSAILITRNKNSFLNYSITS
jgi:N-acetylglucosaminyl-diphospho-decaprenol L-rhamnosyltransferase